MLHVWPVQAARMHHHCGVSAYYVIYYIQNKQLLATITFTWLDNARTIPSVLGRISVSEHLLERISGIYVVKVSQKSDVCF